MPEQLQTRWAEDVDPKHPWPEYPRPQLTRDRWSTLNGPWRAALTGDGDDPPAEFDRDILVPFPMGSVLSGIDEVLQPEQRLWMQRTFSAPPLVDDERLLIHFGGVDWACDVWCNDTHIGRHEGAHDPFSFDLTDALVLSGPQSLTVRIADPTDTGTQPLGKQTLQPFAIQYTAMAGIWQTVWLEPVPVARVASVVTTTSIADGTVAVRVGVAGAAAGMTVQVTATDDAGSVTSVTAAVNDEGAHVEVSPDDLRLWSPDNPHLYTVQAELIDSDGAVIDRVGSYFGAREVDVDRDGSGHLRLRLNGEPLFHLGLLDQGWWPDGGYIAPTDTALAYDIEVSKAMGFNTIRKHVKVEPARWYWHADRLGMLVWQDMPSVRFDMIEFGTQMADGVAPPDMTWDRISPGRDPEGFRRELDAMIEALRPFPSIVVWVPFNEAWGQHDTDAVLAHVAELDPSRLIDGPSGWVDTGSGQIRDHHVYNQEADFPGTETDRPVVYGEYGGLKLVVDGHVARDDGWGYSTAATVDEFDTAYAALSNTIAALVDRGLAGAIYTQTTDVESEINGLLTYDRAVVKLPVERFAEIHRTITTPRPTPSA